MQQADRKPQSWEQNAPTLGRSVHYEKYAAVSMLMTQIGYVYDSTGYYRARYYDPTIGRFISEDPIKFYGGNNFYAYVLNRPTALRDPSGLIAWHCNVALASYGDGLAGAGIIAQCTSDCGKDGYRVTAEVVGGAAGIGVGLKAVGSFSPVDLSDSSDYANPQNLSGYWTYVGAGVAWGPIGGSFSKLWLGDAEGAFGFGWEGGYDLSAGVTHGAAGVVHSTREKCGCSK